MEKIAAYATCRLGLASVFRLAVPVAPGDAPQDFGLTASGGGLPTERPSSPTPAERSPVLVVAFVGVVGLARCLTVRPTGYGDCLAEEAVSRPLATAEPPGEARPPRHCQGDQLTVRSFFLTVFNIWQIFEITEFLKVDRPSALGLFGALDPSVYCGVAIRLYEGSENQRVIGQCLELVQK
jgi:hypothetical protein